jgi:hypothetical protein
MLAAPRRTVARAAAVEAAAPAAAGAATYSGKAVPPPAQGKHFLHLDDFSRADLEDMLARAVEAKQRLKMRDASFKPFKDMSMAMIFTKPSARTRVSFETVRVGCVCVGGGGGSQAGAQRASVQHGAAGASAKAPGMGS